MKGLIHLRRRLPVVATFLVVAACSGGSSGPASSGSAAVGTSSTSPIQTSPPTSDTRIPTSIATGQTTTTFPNAITVGAITFHAPRSWGVIGGPPSAVVGVLAGGRGDVTLRVQTEFTGTVDSLAPKTCLGAPVEAPARVELVESGFKPVGDRTAEFRFWRAACPNGDIKLEEHRAWLLPISQIAIFEQRHEPEVETVVATAHVA